MSDTILLCHNSFIFWLSNLCLAFHVTKFYTVSYTEIRRIINLSSSIVYHNLFFIIQSLQTSNFTTCYWECRVNFWESWQIWGTPITFLSYINLRFQFKFSCAVTNLTYPKFKTFIDDKTIINVILGGLWVLCYVHWSEILVSNK